MKPLTAVRSAAIIYDVKQFAIQQFDMRQAGREAGEVDDMRIGREIKTLCNLIKRYFENHTHMKEIESISGTNSWILGYLSDHMDRDIYQRDLERQFSVTRSTMSKVLGLMEQKGLIERKSVVQDARLKKIVPTEKALGLGALMHMDRQQVESTLRTGFTDEEIRTLYGYIQRMKENISK